MDKHLSGEDTGKYSFYIPHDPMTLNEFIELKIGMSSDFCDQTDQKSGQPMVIFL